jgi:hypothetical protein
VVCVVCVLCVVCVMCVVCFILRVRDGMLPFFIFVFLITIYGVFSIVQRLLRPFGTAHLPLSRQRGIQPKEKKIK